MSFSGQVVWITGASSGIGAALCRAFAADGARVVLSSRRADELERVRRSCARPADHWVVPLDLERPETFAATTAEVLAQTGGLDVLVNNGGLGQRALAADASLASERRILDVNFLAPVALTKAVLPHFRARRRGQVVVVSSVMGYVGVPGRSSYAASKHALHGYFDTLRAELWRDGIQILLACPGYVDTAISTHALGPDGQPHRSTAARPRRGIPPEKCAAAILRGVARRKREVYVGGGEVAGIYLQRFAPWLFARIARRMSFPADAK